MKGGTSSWQRTRAPGEWLHGAPDVVDFVSRFRFRFRFWTTTCSLAATAALSKRVP
jgi:hypothetical protein